LPKKIKSQAIEELGLSSDSEKFYLKPPYLVLIDADLLKRTKNPWRIDLKTLLPDFFDRMMETEIGSRYFRIMGKALQTSAQIYKAKVWHLFESEKKEKERRELERKKRESKELPSLQVPVRHVSETMSKGELMDELIEVLLAEKKRTERRLKRQQKEKEKKLRKTQRKRRVPLVDVMTKEDFAYEVDSERMNVQERNRQVYEVALKLIKESEENEIRFEELLKAMSKLIKDVRVQVARVLLAVLFLIADGMLYAEQEVETKRIWIMEKPPVET